jgi:hypothetical protein
VIKVYKHVNRSVEKILFALAFENETAKINKTDIVLASLLLLATLIISLVMAPVALYEEMYQRYQQRKQRAKQKMRA